MAVAASDLKTLSVVPLNGVNYPTWKVQCRMALMKDGLWNIVNGTEVAPAATDTNSYNKFMARRDRALATIVLSVDPSLLYVIGDPVDPIVVWQKLADQFQKKTWGNKLVLRRKLYSLQLKDGDSVQKHIKAMTEIFDELSVVGDPITDEDRVVYLLASLPESYNMLVTALEANEEVPKMEVVTKRLLHEERKLKNRASSTGACSEKVMTVKQQSHKKGPRPKCHHCGKIGHIKRDCWDLTGKKADKSQKVSRYSKQKANKAEVHKCDYDSSSSVVQRI